MNMAKYCKNKGFTKEEYNNFKSNIKTIAEAIRQQIIYKGGAYYPITEIIPYNTNEELKPFIIQELKSLGVEFNNDYTLYRI